jgi:hypothetical protein
MLIILCRYSSIRSTNITEEIKKAISTKEAEISKAISSTDMQLADVETSLGEIHLGRTGEERGQNVEDTANTVKQIEEERGGLDSSRKLLEELLSRAKEAATLKEASEIQSRSTHITFGSLGKGFQIGTNNAAISGIHF